MPLQEMLEIEAFDEDTVNELRARAKDVLLTMEIAKEESVGEVSRDLRDLDGLTTDLIAKLADAGVHTLDDLADLARRRIGRDHGTEPRGSATARSWRRANAGSPAMLRPARS